MFAIVQWLRIIFGLLLSGLLPCAIAGLLMLMESTGDLNWSQPFRNLCLLSMIVVLPMMFLIDFATRRTPLDELVIGDAEGPDSFTEFFAANLFDVALGNPCGGGAVFLMFFMIPPRMARTGLARLHARRRLGPTHFRLAAGIVHRLLIAGEGVPTQTLFKPLYARSETARNMSILVYLDWIGIAKDAGRTWILTESKERLEA